MMRREQIVWLQADFPGTGLALGDFGVTMSFGQHLQRATQPANSANVAAGPPSATAALRGGGLCRTHLDRMPGDQHLGAPGASLVKRAPR